MEERYGYSQDEALWFDRTKVWPEPGADGETLYEEIYVGEVLNEQDDTIRSLTAANAELTRQVQSLQACHDAELGVCLQHCDEYQDLLRQVEAAREALGRIRLQADFGRHRKRLAPKDADFNHLDAIALEALATIGGTDGPLE